MKTLVVTGGIGSGKSFVCSFFASKGVPVYDSDSRTKSLYDKDRSLVASLEAGLGCSLRDSSGRLDRRRLAERIFSDPVALAAVESVVHPAVLKDFLNWRQSQAGKPWDREAGDVPFVVMESAIILEKPLFRNVADKVMLVDAPYEVRLRRAAARDSRSEAEVEARMARQPFLNAVSDGSVVPNVDYLLKNDAGTEKIIETLTELLPLLWK